MISIEALKKNDVYVTFTEKMVGENYVLLILTSEINPNKKRHILLNNNISLITDRIDKYEIEEGNYPDYSIHKVFLDNDGFYLYEAIELDLPASDPVVVDQQFIDNLSTLYLSTIEIGRLKMSGYYKDINIPDVYK